MGVIQGSVRYTEIPKEMLMVVLPDIAVTKAIKVIETVAKTNRKDSPAAGDHCNYPY